MSYGFPVGPGFFLFFQSPDSGTSGAGEGLSLRPVPKKKITLHIEVVENDLPMHEDIELINFVNIIIVSGILK